MSRRIITVGDMTDHNGMVATGSPRYKFWGRAVARLHDEVDCPQVYPDGRPHGRQDHPGLGAEVRGRVRCA
ncbi:PAAR domain-containing protein [Cupriavidus taiwanensis]|uniref:PAAR domain-containing protein n=1 Tax=Cupriavidus taiwanensis TaxID=164546 RepID=UPI0034A00109